ncbi:MAG TPA: polysaccharide deacetylase family protein [Synergistaceae bacterium]|nr:polysaccharide deacetylase family protein [Synergistaceae bacterium]HQH78020.1 polysaccharide deacetylase family protein [Synergistaceae bacterium]HQK25050.1 polysaccharide deacetylase family protein [Synergistaceae bacterium]
MKVKANRQVLKGALGIGAALALGAAILVASTPKEAVYVLCLHHVAPVPGEDGGMYVSPGEFASLLARLRQGGAAFLSLEEFRRWIEGTGPIPPVSVLLTFDDGYEDNASELLPILRSFDVPAAVFVVGANVGTPGRLSAPQMRAMAQSGLVAFGSHTQHHRDLRGLSAAQLTEEFAGSRAFLEGLLEVSVDVLSYPNGRNGPAIRRMAAKSGYALAFGTEGAPCTRSSDPMNLPRYTPGAFSRALGWRLAIRRLLE